MKTASLLMVALLATALSACTWVQTTEGGKQVTLVKAFNVTDCKKLGSTTTSVKAKIGYVERDNEKMTKESVALAKNTAAKMGGDSIVATSPLEEGSMTFDIYKCAP